MKLSKLTTTASLSVLLTAMIMFSSGCTYAWKGIRGNGNVIKQDREISSFNGIEVGGAFHVYLTQGDKESLTIEADENLLEIIETTVRGGILEIDTRQDIRDATKLNVYITFTKLSELDISGACHLKGENKFKLDELDIDCSGASEVVLKLAAQAIELDCSGASHVDLYGTSKTISFDLSGASHLDAADLEVENGVMEISGASHAKVNVTGEISAEVSGAGSLKYKGNAKLIDPEVSGAGSIKKM